MLSHSGSWPLGPRPLQSTSAPVLGRVGSWSLQSSAVHAVVHAVVHVIVHAAEHTVVHTAVSAVLHAVMHAVVHVAVYAVAHAVVHADVAHLSHCSEFPGAQLDRQSALSGVQLLGPSAGLTAFPLLPVTLSPLVCFHVCLHARKCVFASLLPTGIAIPQSSAL